jgi:cytochrome c553
MLHMRRTRAFGLTLMLSLAAGASAADAENGQALAWQHRCMTCHGPEGHSQDDRYPYIVDRLKYFKAETEHFNQMNGQARPLSIEDMEDLAAYFSAQR